MSSYTQTWDETSPAGTAKANTLDTVIQNFKVAVRERLNTEHYAFTDTSSIETVTCAGRHRPGIVGVVYSGTTAQIDAKVSPAELPGNGALAWDTTLSALKKYDSVTNTWGIISSSSSCYFRVTKVGETSTQSITTSETQLTWNTEDVDIGSNFATNQFVAPSAGFYSFTLRAGATTGIPAGSAFTTRISKNDTIVAYGNVCPIVSGSTVSGLALMLLLAQNDVIKAHFYCNGAGGTISADIKYTSWEGIKLA